MRKWFFILFLSSISLPAQTVPPAIAGAPTTDLPITAGTRARVGDGPYSSFDQYGNLEVPDILGSGGNVDVRLSQFAVGCANGADQSGNLDSLCAIQNAYKWIVAHPVAGSGFANLYFPHGRYKIGSLPVPAHGTLLHVTSAVSFKGDGPARSIIDNVSPSSSTLVLDNANQCHGGSGPECPVYLEGINFHQGGHLSLGDGIEAINTAYGVLINSQISNSGGVAFSLNGSSERWVVTNDTISNSAASVHEVGDTNEENFERVDVINSGQDESGYCYSSPVCVNHALPAVGQTWYPNPRPTVYLDGVKNVWRDSSIKGLIVDSGIRAPRELGVIEANYFEGYSWGGQPRFNSAVYAGGKMELSHTLAPMTVSSTTVAVDDAMFQPGYVNNPADVTKAGSHASADTFFIFPQDYLVNSTAPSTKVPGIPRGYAEAIQVWGTAGDGNFYIRNRGYDGSLPVAWPAGSIIEQLPLSYMGAVRLASNHLNANSSIPVYGPSTYLDGCDDLLQRSNWVGNPSRTCAANFVGYVPDGYAVSFPSPSYAFSVEGSMTFEDNTNFTGGSEADGIGYTKVMANGYVNLVADQPLTQIPNFDQIRDTYANGMNTIKFANYAGVWALGAIEDAGAHVTSIPAWGYFDGVIAQYGQGATHILSGTPCTTNFVSGAISVNQRTCTPPSGAAYTQTLVGGVWVP